MSDAPFIISSSGLIADVNWNKTPQEGLGPSMSQASPYTVTQLLPGGVVQVAGNSGQVNLTGQLGAGTRGSLQIDLLTTTAGAAASLAMLVGQQSGTVTEYLGVAIDASNRPYFIITDALGTVAATFTPAGAAIPSGTPLQVRLFWDSAGTVLPGYVAFQINGTTQSFAPITSAWTPFSPVAVLTALGGFGGLANYGGTIRKVQAGGTP